MINCRQRGCDFTASTVGQVQAHAWNEHELRLVPCVACQGKLYTNSDLRLHHAQYHAGEMRCLFCDDTFRSSSAASTHIYHHHKRIIGTHEAIQNVEPLQGQNLLERMNQVIEYPTDLKVIIREQFVVVYNVARNRPLFVFEDLNPGMILDEPPDRPNHAFVEDPELPFKQITPEAINYLEFVNGHLAPSADHVNSPTACAESFLMSNICPMHKRVNSGVWHALERFVRTLAKKWSAVRVVTGPIYSDEAEFERLSIGCVVVSIPTHFFKVIIMERQGEPDLTQAFVVPNQFYQLTTSIFKHRTTMEEIEKRTGLNIIGKQGRSMTWNIRTSIPLFKCTLVICNKTFLSQELLDEHVRMHELEHRCKFCKRTFGTSKLLQDHLDRNHWLECPYEKCKFTNQDRGKLNDHLKYHTGERNFKCPNCDLAFIMKIHLEVHMRTHTGEKPYKCSFEDCGAEFAHSGNLTDHMNAHAGIKPFVCDVGDCRKAFTKLSNLKVHKLTHTGEKLYKCTYDDCNHACSSNEYLQSHIIAQHSKVKPFKCAYPNCTKAYCSARALRVHVKKAHEDEEEGHTKQAPKKIKLAKNDDDDDDDIIVLD